MIKPVVSLARLMLALAVCGGCSRSDLSTPAAFTREFADAFRKAQPGLKVTIVKDLELRIGSADEHAATCFLDNAYDAYKLDPKAKAEVMARFVTSGLESLDSSGHQVDRMRIVPVIKDRAWLEETRRAMLSRGAKKAPEHVYDDFSPDLIVLYAEDSPKNIRYLTPTDLDPVNVERTELRALACENLKRLLPNIQRHGTNGFYMLTAGGDYEASLLLLDFVWSDGGMEVNGDIVVALPTRDLLLVTGSRNREGLDKLKQMAKEASSKMSYRLTDKLFIYRKGKFVEFDEREAAVPQRQ